MCRQEPPSAPKCIPLFLGIVKISRIVPSLAVTRMTPIADISRWLPTKYTIPFLRQKSGTIYESIDESEGRQFSKRGPLSPQPAARRFSSLAAASAIWTRRACSPRDPAEQHGVPLLRAFNVRKKPGSNVTTALGVPACNSQLYMFGRVHSHHWHS